MPIFTQRAFSFIQCRQDWTRVSPSGSLIQGLSKIDLLDFSKGSVEGTRFFPEIGLPNRSSRGVILLGLQVLIQTWFGNFLLLLEFSFLPEDIGHVWWMAHCLHEQVDIVQLVLEIVIVFEVVKTFHELIKILIE